MKTEEITTKRANSQTTHSKTLIQELNIEPMYHVWTQSLFIDFVLYLFHGGWPSIWPRLLITAELKLQFVTQSLRRNFRDNRVFT